MNNSQELIKSQVDQLTLKTKESLKNLKRIAIDEAWKILQLTTAAVIQIIENSANHLSGKDKKELAISLINNFYDAVFVVVDIPFVPSALEPIIHTYVKKILMTMVSSSIDAMVTIFRNTGVFIKQKVTS